MLGKRKICSVLENRSWAITRWNNAKGQPCRGKGESIAVGSYKSETKEADQNLGSNLLLQNAFGVEGVSSEERCDCKKYGIEKVRQDVKWKEVE